MIHQLTIPRAAIARLVDPPNSLAGAEPRTGPLAALDPTDQSDYAAAGCPVSSAGALFIQQATILTKAAPQILL